MPSQIPEVVVQRLPLYARTLAQLLNEQVEVISSQELGERLQMTPAQIRKDLSYFGKFGKQGRGYNVSHLLGVLRGILGLERTWRLAVVGVGHLGQAIMAYGGFEPEGFQVVAAFDNNPQKIGQRIAGTLVQNIEELPGVLGRQEVDIGIVAVPAAAGQKVASTLVEGGVRAILNYAPTTVRVPEGIKVRTIDPVLALQSMTFYLKSPEDAIPTAGRRRTRRRR